jgi:hypothetical protein
MLVVEASVGKRHAMVDGWSDAIGEISPDLEKSV